MTREAKAIAKKLGVSNKDFETESARLKPFIDNIGVQGKRKAVIEVSAQRGHPSSATEHMIAEGSALIDAANFINRADTDQLELLSDMLHEGASPGCPLPICEMILNIQEALDAAKEKHAGALAAFKNLGL